ncbi:MAG: response regulator, partial [Acidaminobacteraceae bacterium]
MATIMIVDDSIIIRKALKKILVSLDHEVIAEVSNGREAVEQYALNQADIVTMDLSMPIMDGINAVKEIVEDYSEARIVMISAIDQKHLVFEALEAGAKHYIVKPFDRNIV